MTLAEALESLGLGHLLATFRHEGVDMRDLASLGNDELVALGVTRLGDRNRLRVLARAASSATGGSSEMGAPAQAALDGRTRVVGSGGGDTSGALDGGTRAGFAVTGGTRPGNSPPEQENVPERIGSYRMLGRIGAGGMGTVWRARHVEEGWARRQGGDVAIKLVHPSLAQDPVFRERFFAEAAIGKRVQHPSLVTTHEVLAEGEFLGMVMPFVQGTRLTSFVRPGGMALDEVIDLVASLGAAIDHLDTLGIVHRDIKPANIIVRPDGAPLILDLGIAKDAGATENHTKTATAMGTMAWMAPEQADAKHVDGAADRYALGLIAYSLLSGRMPWGTQTSEYRVVAMKLGGQLDGLADVAAVPAHVDAAVMRMLALDPRDRFPTCASFVAALRATVADTALGPPRDAAPGSTTVHGGEAGRPAPAPASRAADVVPAAASVPPAAAAPSVPAVVAPAAASSPAAAGAATPSTAAATVPVASSGAAPWMVIGLGLGVAGLAVVGAAVWWLTRGTPEATAGSGAPGIAAAPASGPALDRIRARGALLVGIDTGEPAGSGTPPMYFPDAQGQPDGFDVQVAYWLAKDIGVEQVTVVHGKYSELPGMLVAQQFDVIISGYTPSNDQGVSWSDGYLDFGLCLTVPANSKVRSLDDLAGHAVGIFDDDAAASEVRALLPGARSLIRMEDGYWDALVAGHFDGFVYDYPYTAAELNAYYQANPDRRGAFKTVAYNLNQSHYSVGVRATETDLLDAVNHGVATFLASEVYSDAVKRYLSGGTKVDTDPASKYFARWHRPSEPAVLTARSRHAAAA